MHTNDTKTRFVALRVNGLSLARIAKKLGVSKTTLIDWNRQLQPQIQALRAVEWEALQEKFVASREQELVRLADTLEKIEAELGERTFKGMHSYSLVGLAALVRRQLRELCFDPTLLQPVTPVTPAVTATPTEPSTATASSPHAPNSP